MESISFFYIKKQDPVTGSAHAVMASIWIPELRKRQVERSRKLLEEQGRGGGDGGGGVVGGSSNEGDQTIDGLEFWPARQLSARGGELSVCLLEETERVLVGGGAAVALEGWAHV